MYTSEAKGQEELAERVYFSDTQRSAWARGMIPFRGIRSDRLHYFPENQSSACYSSSLSCACDKANVSSYLYLVSRQVPSLS